MSQLDSTNAGGIYEEKPGSNIYTAMLGIAFLALCTASAMLAMELSAYDFDTKGETARKATPRSVEALRAEQQALNAPVEEAATDLGTGVDASAPAATPAAPATTPATPAAPAVGAGGFGAMPATTPAAPAAGAPAVGAPAVGAPAVGAPAVGAPAGAAPATPATPAAPGAAAPGAAAPTTPATPGTM